MKNTYSIQLFTMSEFAKENLENTFKIVSEIGYKQVEFAGFFGHSAEQVREWLDKYDLTVSSAHVPLPILRDSFEQTVKYHKTIGNKYFIMPMEDLNSQEKLDKFVIDVENVKPRLESLGMELGYHNHLHEFHPNTDGSMIYDQVTSRTDVFLEIDGGWVNAAGEKPLEVMNKYKDRVKFIHLRDSIHYKGPVTGVPMMDIYADVFKCGIGKPLSQGTAPIDEIYKLAVENGWKMVVECEAKVPDGATAAKLCMDYIKILESKY